MKRAIALAAFALALVSCSSLDEQAVRHLAIAELIERQKIPEDRIEIKSVQLLSTHEAVAEAAVSAEPSRGGPRRILRCILKKEGNRWIVLKVEDA